MSLRSALFGLLLAGATSFAAANPIVYTVDFTANDFWSGPLSSVHGSLSATIDSAHAHDFQHPGTLDTLNLNIGGHEYLLNDASFAQNGNWLYFGGNSSGLGGVSAGSNDFLLYFNTLDARSYFMYATPQTSIWDAGHIDLQISTASPAAVPEPGALALLGLGLAGLCGVRRRAV